MSRPVDIQETLTFNPTGYTGATNMSESSNYPWTRGCNSISNTSSYARLQLSASSTSTDCYIYYTFSVSDIPSNATITNVSCIARIYRNSRVTANTAAIQLYNGTTAKGAETNSFGTTASNVTISNTGSWTVSELNDIRLRIKGRRSNTSNSSYIYFYGANLSITYSIQGTEYEIVSTIATNAVDSIDPSGQTWVFGGGSYDLNIYADSIDDVMVEDNGIDVTDQLSSAVVPGETEKFTGIPTSYDSVNSSYDSIYEGTTSNPLGPYDNSSRICVFANTTANSISKLTYNFDCSSIPRNAIITSVTCQAGAACYSNGQYFSTRNIQLYSGSTPKGTPTTITGTGNTNTAHTVDGGSWTRSELDNAKIVLYIQRGNNTTQASFSFWGATLVIEYSVSLETYWTYSLTNVSEDHTIIVKDSVIEIPDEDPQYDYYSITTSSANATTNPGRGTIRLVEGSNQTVTIYPSDPRLTLALDNGTDISSQLVTHGGTIPDPTVATASGASYGFNYNSTTGYYTSANKGVDKSAAVCVLSFNLPVRCLVTIEYINYAEATYDFGVFGNIDTPLSNNYYAAGSNGATITDSSYKLACNTSTYNTSSVQTITYEVPSGEHQIYIKYSKDDASASNNDTLQFKVSSIEALEPNNYYTYTLSNISQDHSLIFVFGDVTYYLVTTSGSNARLFPSGSMIVLPGDGYILTVVPDDYSYIVSNATDNNNEITLERVEKEITKDGSTYTVVNYIYELSNVSGNHTIYVECQRPSSLYIKVSGSWETPAKVYTKKSNHWIEVTDPSDIMALFQPNTVYVHP